MGACQMTVRTGMGALGFLVFLAAGLHVPEAQAEVRRKAGLSALSAGMGDATRSTSVGHNALLLNPAAMSQVRTYQITTGFGYGHEGNQVIPTLSLVDSALNPLMALGVGYTYRGASDFLGDNNPRREHHTRGAISTGYAGADFGLFLGAGATWLNMGQDSGDAFDALTADLSMLVMVLQTLRIGVVGHNLFELTENPSRADMPRSLGTGVSASAAQFLVSFDTDTDFDSYEKPTTSYHVGAQAMVLPPSHSGSDTRQTPAKRPMLTGGIGYWTTAFMADVGFQQNLSNSADFFLGLDLVFALN